MIIPDRRKLATVIVSRLHSDGGQSDDVAVHGDSELVSLAQEFLHAVKQGDAQATADAFRALFMACEAMPHSEAGEVE